MRKYISLIRGINVGGKTLKMDKLRSIYQSLKFSDIKTYIQSGNVLFNSRSNDVEKIEDDIVKKILSETGLTVSVIIRKSDELGAIIAKNPFIKRDIKETKRLYITFLEKEPSKESIKNIILPKPTKDEFILLGKEIYLFCPAGYGETILSNTFFEKKLKMGATTRNWNTTNKLYELSLSE